MRNSTLFVSMLLLMAAASLPALRGYAEPLILTREARFVSSDVIRAEVSIVPDASAAITSLGFKEILPEGWRFSAVVAEYYGQEEKVAVNLWENEIDFYWITVPALPLKIVYDIEVDVYDSGQFIAGELYTATEFSIDLITLASPVTWASDIACVTVARTVLGDGYVPGQPIRIQLMVSGYCPESVQNFSLEETLSAPWTFRDAHIVSSEDTLEKQSFSVPEPDSESPFTFTWTTPPAFPLVLEYTLVPHTAANGTVEVAGTAQYDQAGESVIVHTPVSSIAPLELPGEGEAPATGLLLGVVRNAETGLPVSNARIDVTPGDITRETGFWGTYSVAQLPYGSYLIEVTAEGYRSHVAFIDVVSPFVTLDLLVMPLPEEGEPEPTGALVGFVRAAGTQLPVADAQVYVVEADMLRTTGPLGAYSVDGLAYGTYTLDITAEGYTSRSETVLLDDIIVTVDIVLTPESGEGEPGMEGEGESEGEPTGSLGGFVLDADSLLPVADALVTLTPGNVQTNTAELGSYLFGDLAYGEYELLIEAEGYVSYTDTIVITTPVALLNAFITSSDATPEGETPDAAVIVGIVLDATTTLPVAGATVSVVSMDVDMETQTNAFGTFSIADLPYGEYEIEIVADGYGSYNANIRVEEPLVALTDIVLLPSDIQPEGETEEMPTGALLGVALDANTGGPLGGIQIRLMPGGAMTETNALGVFSFAALTFGVYTIEVEEDGYHPYQAEVEINNQIVNTVTVRLDPTEEEPQPEGTLLGVVRSAATQLPIANALVKLTPGNIVRETRIAGTYSIAGLLHGAYTINVTASGYKAYSETVQISDAIVTLDILLPLSGGEAEGESEEEGEEEITEDEGGGGCFKCRDEGRDKNVLDTLRKTLGDWLLVGMALMTVLALSKVTHRA